MKRIEPEQLFDEIRLLLERHDAEALRRRLRESDAADLAEIVEMLGDEDQQMFMAALDSEEAGEVLSMVDEATRGELVDDMTGQTLTGVVATMRPDDAADLLGELPEEQSEDVIERLPAEQAADVATLLQYEEDTAGGLMTPEFISVAEDATVSHVVAELRKMELEEEEPFYIYVVDDAGRVRGVVPLHKLITARPNTPVSAIMDRDLVTVLVGDDQEEVARVFRRHDVPEVPVLDATARLVGRITHDDVADVIVEEADEDMLRMGGTDAAELERASSVRAARVRMTWLLPCLIGAVCSGLAMAAFQARIDAHEFLILVLFNPMIAAMGGNSGVQASTTTIRGLATGELVGQRLILALRRESSIARITGAMCGVLAGGIACAIVGALEHLGKVGPSPPAVGCAVGLAMFLGINVAVVMGTCLPFFFQRVGIDPAIASGPVVTTTNDTISVTIYMTTGAMMVSLFGH